MSLEILLIRHGKTAGNLEGRYVGRTDEVLCPIGRLEIEALRDTRPFDQTPDIVLTSPLKRCQETANILWPETLPVLVTDFRECDFGDFEYKNYKELNGDERYQAWIDSGGTLPFPHGESVEEFKERVQKAFRQVLKDLQVCGCEKAAMTVHGGTIMAIMEKWGTPAGEYFKWQLPNGGWITLKI
jgi:alpha-ribazole phosphatase